MQVYIDWIYKFGAITGVTIVTLTTLFLFTNLTTEFYDTPKFLILLAVTGLLLVFLAVKFTINGKVVLARTPLDLPLLLLISVAIVSTLLSQSPYVALLGNQLKIHGSAVSLVVYILFYFVLVNTFKNAKEVKGLFFILTYSAAFLSIVTLASYAGVRLLPSSWTQGINFTPTGSPFSTTALLALLVPSVTSQLLSSNNRTIKGINSLFLTLFGLTIALTGSLAVWTAAAVGFILVLLIHRSFFEKITQIKPLDLAALIAPIVIVGLVSFLSLVPPMGGAQNPLYSQAKNFPRESQLSLTTSWKIAASAFRDSPFWGSGPSTFLFNFTNYKPLEYNSTKNWNLRFDNAFNEYLQVLATLGGIGLLALLSITGLFLSSAWLHLKNAIQNSSFHPGDEIKHALAISGLIFFIILALHTSSLVLWVFGVIILASYMTVASKGQVLNSRLQNPAFSNIKDTIFAITGNLRSAGASVQTLKIEALPSILVVISSALVLFAFFFAGKFVVADYHHKKALNAVAQNQGIAAYNELVAAEKLNPYNDLYRTDLAQTNFALANAIAAAKGPTEASPSGSLTDTDKQNIQVLLQQSVSEGRTATTLSPRSALNWEILALLYRQIAGVAQNALTFSLDSYGKAIFQDPLNPNLRLSVGGVYYAVQNYDLAIRFFTDAINLKPDFSNGYYNLSVALRDKGDLKAAQETAEKVLTLLEAGSEDYKLASDYLNDLKNKIDSSSTTATGSAIQPPAAQTSGSLQKKELPKVVDVGNPPEKIATPPAVKKSATKTEASSPKPSSQP